MLPDLIHLAHMLASPDGDMCILAEGNVSGVADAESFWVKASGQSMASVRPEGFSRVRTGAIWAAIHQRYSSDEEIRAALNDACIEGPPPSTETFMHAALLALPGVEVVGHTHPTPLLSILSLREAEEWANQRLFPDEIVCCGPAACYIPYVAPGLELARSIQRETEVFRERLGINPKTYWLKNHGLIAVGSTIKEVESACRMSVKSARVLLGALSTGKHIDCLSEEEVAHIYHWPDEHARQKALWGGD